MIATTVLLALSFVIAGVVVIRGSHRRYYEKQVREAEQAGLIPPEDTGVMTASERHAVGRGLTFAGVFLAVLLAIGAWHEIGVFASKDNPPASCQLLGGQWNMFTGWQCD